MNFWAISYRPLGWFAFDFTGNSEKPAVLTSAFRLKRFRPPDEAVEAEPAGADGVRKCAIGLTAPIAGAA
jgi:hypothetical protein